MLPSTRWPGLAEQLERAVVHELHAELGHQPSPAPVKGGHGFLGQHLVARHRVAEHGSSWGTWAISVSEALTSLTTASSLMMWNQGSTSWNQREPLPRRSPSVSDTATGTRALDRAADLVAAVVHADEPMSFADLQDASGLAKSTTSRMLTALERSGLLERDPAGSYVAGRLFWLYAARHDPWEELVRLARPVMQRIGDDDRRDGAPQRRPRRPRRPGRAGGLDLPPRHPRLDRGRRARPLLRAGQGLPRLGRARRSPTASWSDRRP